MILAHFHCSGVRGSAELHTCGLPVSAVPSVASPGLGGGGEGRCGALLLPETGGGAVKDKYKIFL